MEADNNSMENDNSEMGGGASSSSSSRTFNMNPSAQAWDPAPEHDRSLFFTFSYGLPLSRDQILAYFTRYYDNRVVNVEIYTSHGRALDSGKIVFDRASIPNTILNGRDEVKLTIDGRSIWLKKYNRRY